MIASDEPCVRAPVVSPGRVEQVGEHADAALLDLGRLRVLGVVDEVAVQVLGDDPLRLGLHPRRHERREVAHRDPVEHELLPEQAHRVQRGHPVLRQLLCRCVALEEAVSEPLLELVGAPAVGSVRFGVLGFNGHFRSSSESIRVGASRHSSLATS